MGYFSWLDCENNKQIKIGEKAYALIPKEYGGGHIEAYYDGYGHFGNTDIYDLVVDWNEEYLEEYRKDNSFECDWLQNQFSVEDAFKNMEKRDIGISIACYDSDNKKLHYPIKITHNPQLRYEDCDFSPSDPLQRCN